MIKLRTPAEIYQAHGQIGNGTFHGRWHFSFDRYHDPDHVQFGTVRVFNDDTLSPGAVWPLHPHREIEVVTYCAEGEFRHADEHGVGGVLQKGWVQHTTVGKGMLQSEINNRADESMRFIQMWFIPSKRRLEPAVQQRRVEREDRANRFLLLVSNQDAEALPIRYENHSQLPRGILDRCLGRWAGRFFALPLAMATVFVGFDTLMKQIHASLPCFPKY